MESLSQIRGKGWKSHEEALATRSAPSAAESESEILSVRLLFGQLIFFPYDFLVTFFVLGQKKNAT